jgi:hypothetical protein
VPNRGKESAFQGYLILRRQDLSSGFWRVQAREGHARLGQGRCHAREFNVLREKNSLFREIFGANREILSDRPVTDGTIIRPPERHVYLSLLRPFGQPPI